MKKLILIALVVLTPFIGCKDTIDFLPTGSYNEVVVWENEESVKLYINSFYRIFTDYFQFGNRPVGNDFTMSDGLSDIMKYTSNVPGEGTANLIMSQDGYTSVAANHFNVWSSAYVWNRRMLEFLEDLPRYGGQFSEATRNRFEAEVRFFRAYIFFLLYRNQGPFIIRDALNDPVAMPLDTPEACWDFIEADFDFAAEHLPPSWSRDTDEGRVTKWAALALKSRAMLYAMRWSKAAQAAEIVIQQGGFILEPNYAEIFKNNKSNPSREIILRKRYDRNYGIIHNMDERVAPSGDIQGKGGAMVPTQELVDAYFMSDGQEFDPNSPFDSTMYLNRESRFYASILYNGATWKGRRIETFVGEAAGIPNGRDRFIEYGSTPYPFSTVSGYYIRKFADENNIDFIDPYRKSDHDCIEIRLAEVYLNLAEAYLELNRPQDAKQQILAVRNRSLQQDVSDISGELRQQLLRERMLELAFEGHRFWDLRRWGIAREILHDKKWHGAKIIMRANGTQVYQKVEIDKFPRIYPERFNRFPLPIAELNNNEFITTQPDGW